MRLLRRRWRSISKGGVPRAMVRVPRAIPVGECITTGCGTSYRLYRFSNFSFTRLVLLNALVPPSDGGVIAITPPLSIEEVKLILENAKEIESYIGHESTAKLLSRLANKEIQVNRGMWSPVPDTYVLVVRLRRRLPRSGDVEVRPEDLEFRLALYNRFDEVE